jgi:tRNA-splicing ligase RtcB
MATGTSVDINGLNVKRIADCVWEISKSGRMNVPARIFASDVLLKQMSTDRTLQQTANVATLPGIVGASLAMPDAHQGYGFPVGGVAAFDIDDGVISPGGVGFDINCGVRLLTTPFDENKVAPLRSRLLDAILKAVPAGAGREGGLELSKEELDNVLENGIDWAVKNGYATKEDRQHTEENGRMDKADASKVSAKAKARGMPQLGTLGSGNHFLELQRVDRIVLPEVAKAFGIDRVGQVVVMVHCGSRGLGHQVCGDYIERIEGELGVKHLADPELASAPINSVLGQDYRSAMAGSVNFAFTNRQLITHYVRQAFERLMGTDADDIGLMYDVCHNIAKFEKHKVGKKQRELCVHRKGATRAFGPGREEIPAVFRDIGQPVFIPGSMGTASYVLVGSHEAEEQTWASTAHGAGRVMSRHEALRHYTAKDIKSELARRGIEIHGASGKGIAEEAPGAYKDVDEVVRVSDVIGIGKIVARLTPLGVIKG